MVDSEWTYKESLCYIRKIKEKYKGIMSSFSVLGKNKNYFEKVCNLKKEIYSLTFDNWKIDKLWEYLNDDIEYIELWKFV